MLSRHVSRVVPDCSGYVMGRTHINSCDFSVSSYSFDDVAGDVGAASTEHVNDRSR